MRWNTESVKEFLKNDLNNEYTLLEPYENFNTKLHLLHNTCKNECYVHLQYLKKGRGCPTCGNKNRTQTKRNSRMKEFNNYISTIKDKVVLSNECETLNDKKLKIKCLVCNSVYETTPIAFRDYKNNGCPVCKWNHLYRKER